MPAEKIIELLIGALGAVSISFVAYYVQQINQAIKDIKTELHADRKILFEHINNTDIHLTIK